MKNKLSKEWRKSLIIFCVYLILIVISVFTNKNVSLITLFIGIFIIAYTEFRKTRFKITFIRSTIIPLIFGVGLIIYGIHSDSEQFEKNYTFFNEKFDEINESCSNNKCEEQTDTQVIFLEDSTLTNYCPHFSSDTDVNLSMSHGSISLWVKLIRINNSIVEDYQYNTITYRLKGIFDYAILLLGPREIYEDKRVLFDITDYEDKSIMQIYIENEDSISLTMYDNNEQPFDISYNKKKPLSEWTHIAVTWDSEIIKMYVDAHLRRSINTQGLDFSQLIKKLYVGASSNGRYCLNGAMDEIVGMSRPLTELEVLSLKEEGVQKS